MQEKSPLPDPASVPAAPAWFGHFPLYLAPMAGFSDIAFRTLCREQGVDVLVSEFVLADSLLRDCSKAWALCALSPGERPVGIQLFGSDPDRMAEAAIRVAGRIGPDFIDINCGCPAERITDMNAGSSLLRDLPLLERIVTRTVAAVAPLPVTVKIRTGWDASDIVAIEVARRVEQAGARVLAVHGRTRAQGYSGEADWGLIAQVAESVRIPVVGNGGVRSAADVLRWTSGTRIAGAMVGRAALGNPWIFREIKAGLAGVADPGAVVSDDERWAAMFRYARMLLDLGRSSDLVPYRPRLLKLTKGMRCACELRRRLEHCRTIDDLHAAREGLGREWA